MQAEEEEGVWEGRSRTSFAEAAYNAVAKAEEERGDDAPLEFEITLRATRTPGSSLSETSPRREVAIKASRRHSTRTGGADDE